MLTSLAIAELAPGSFGDAIARRYSIRVDIDTENGRQLVGFGHTSLPCLAVTCRLTDGSLDQRYHEQDMQRPDDDEDLFGFE